MDCRNKSSVFDGCRRSLHLQVCWNRLLHASGAHIITTFLASHPAFAVRSIAIENCPTYIAAPFTIWIVKSFEWMTSIAAVFHLTGLFALFFIQPLSLLDHRLLSLEIFLFVLSALFFEQPLSFIHFFFVFIARNLKKPLFFFYLFSELILLLLKKSLFFYNILFLQCLSFFLKLLLCLLNFLKFLLLICALCFNLHAFYLENFHFLLLLLRYFMSMIRICFSWRTSRFPVVVYKTQVICYKRQMVSIVTRNPF